RFRVGLLQPLLEVFGLGRRVQGETHRSEKGDDREEDDETDRALSPRHCRLGVGKRNLVPPRHERGYCTAVDDPSTDVCKISAPAGSAWEGNTRFGSRPSFR